MKKITSAVMSAMIMASPMVAMAQTTPAPTQSVPTQSATNLTEAPKKPHGCLAVGTAGAVGGHFIGKGHGVLGAVAGCAYGWHSKHKWKKEMKAWKASHPNG